METEGRRDDQAPEEQKDRNDRGAASELSDRAAESVGRPLRRHQGDSPRAARRLHRRRRLHAADRTTPSVRDASRGGAAPPA